MNSSNLVIVADDDPTICHALKRYLNRMGFEVKTLSNGFEVLLTCLYCVPALIISDIRMPKLDGLFLLKALRNNQNTGQVPVIFVSAVKDERVLEKAMEMGAANFLIKPFRLEDLEKAVDSALCQEYYIG